jgi:hypothetical protein
MKKFSVFLTEQKNNVPFTQNQQDFFFHLTHPVVNSKIELATLKKHLIEITLIDNRNKGKKSSSPSMLLHPQVTQNHPERHKEHVERHQKILANGKKIAENSPSGNIHKDIKAGFDSYEALSPEGKKKAQKEASSHIKGYMRTKFGYGASSPPKYFGANTKIKKNDGTGAVTTGFSGAPATTHGIVGHDACPNSSTECRNSCLGYTTGQNAMLGNINSKASKHQYMAEHPHHAAALWDRELANHVDKTVKAQNKEGVKHEAHVRVNVTTDYNYGHTMGKMLDRHAERAKGLGVEFKTYGYTKNPRQANNTKGPKWDSQVLSHTGAGHSESNDKHVGEHLARGGTVASVISGNATHFHDRNNGRTYKIVDGDKDDLVGHGNRQREAGLQTDEHGMGHKNGKPEGVVSALRLKSLKKEEGKKIAGNFVSHTEDYHHPEHGAMKVIHIN